MESEEELTCPQCQQRYAKEERCPRSLFCGHTFCTSCLDQVIASGSRQCPSCNRAFFSQTAAQLPTNFTLLKRATSTSSTASTSDRLSSKSSSGTYSSPFRPLSLSSSSGLEERATSGSASSRRSFQLPQIGKSSYVSPLTSSTSTRSYVSDIYSKPKVSSSAGETEPSFSDVKTTEEDVSSGDASSKPITSLSYKFPSIRSSLSTRDQRRVEVSGSVDKEACEGMSASSHGRLKQTSLPLTTSALRASAPSVVQTADKEQSLAASSVSRTASESALTRSLSSPYTSQGRDTSHNISTSLSSLSPGEISQTSSSSIQSHTHTARNSSSILSRGRDEGRYTGRGFSVTKDNTGSTDHGSPSESSKSLHKLDTKLQSPPSNKLSDEVDQSVLGWKMDSSLLSSKSPTATSDKNQAAKTSSTPSHVLKMCRSIASKSRPTSATFDDRATDTHSGNHDSSLASREMANDKEQNWETADDASRSSLNLQSPSDVTMASEDSTAEEQGEDTDRDKVHQERMQSSSRSFKLGESYSKRSFTSSEYSTTSTSYTSSSSRLYSRSRGLKTEDDLEDDTTGDQHSLSYKTSRYDSQSSQSKWSDKADDTRSRPHTRSHDLKVDEEAKEDTMRNHHSLSQENSTYRSYSPLSTRSDKSEDKTMQEKGQDDAKLTPSASLGARLRGRTSYLSGTNENTDELNLNDTSTSPGRRNWARRYRGIDSDESGVTSSLSTQPGSLSSRISSRTSYISQDLKKEGTDITDYRTRRSTGTNEGEAAKTEERGGQRRSLSSMYKMNKEQEQAEDSGDREAAREEVKQTDTTDYRTRRSAGTNEDEAAKTEERGGQRRSLSSRYKMNKEQEQAEDSGDRKAAREEVKDSQKEVGTRRKWLSSIITDKHYGDYKASDSSDSRLHSRQDLQEQIKDSHDRDTARDELNDSQGTRRDWRTRRTAEKHYDDYKTSDSHLQSLDSQTNEKKYDTSRTDEGLDRIKKQPEPLERKEVESEYKKGRTADNDTFPDATSTPVIDHKEDDSPPSTQLQSSYPTGLDKDNIQEPKKETTWREYNSSDSKYKEKRFSSDHLSKTSPSDSGAEISKEDSEAEVRTPRFRSNRKSRDAFSLTDYHSMLLKRLPTNEEIARKAYDRFLYRQASKEMDTKSSSVYSREATTADSTDGRSKRVTEYSVRYKPDKQDKDGDSHQVSEHSGRYRSNTAGSEDKNSNQVTGNSERYKSDKASSEGSPSDARRYKQWQSETGRDQNGRTSASTEENSTMHDNLSSLSRNSTTNPTGGGVDTFDAGQRGWDTVTRRADHSHSQYSGRNQSDQSKTASVAATRKERVEPVRPRVSYTEMLSQLKISSVPSTHEDDDEGQDVVDQGESEQSNQKDSSVESKRDMNDYKTRTETSKTPRSYSKYQSTANNTYTSHLHRTRDEDETDHKEKTHIRSHIKHQSVADNADNSPHHRTRGDDETDDRKKSKTKTSDSENSAHDILARARLRLARLRERDADHDIDSHKEDTTTSDTKKHHPKNEELEEMGKEHRTKETKDRKEKKETGKQDREMEEKEKEKKEMKETKEKKKEGKETEEKKEEAKEAKDASHHHHHRPRWYRKYHHETRRKEEEKDIGLELRNARSQLRTTIDTSPPRHRSESPSSNKSDPARSNMTSTKEEENQRPSSSAIHESDPDEYGSTESYGDERKENVQETRKSHGQDSLISASSHNTEYDHQAKETAGDSLHAKETNSQAASPPEVTVEHGSGEISEAAGTGVMMPDPNEQQAADFPSTRVGEDTIDFSHESGPRPGVGVCRRHGKLLSKYCTTCEQWACDRCLRKRHLPQNGCHVISAQDAVSHMKLSHSAYLTSRVDTLEAFREQLMNIVTQCDQSMREHQVTMAQLQLKMHEEQKLLQGIQSMKNLALQKWQQVDYWEQLLEESADRITQSSSSEEVMSAVQSATSSILARVMDGAAPL